MIKKKPWYERRSEENDPARKNLGLWGSKHERGRQPKRYSDAKRVRKNARAARARTFNWPRGE